MRIASVCFHAQSHTGAAPRIGHDGISSARAATSIAARTVDSIVSDLKLHFTQILTEQVT